MIKTQTAVKGVRREGGRKEGRRSVSWRDGGQAGYAEGEGGGEGGGETQGWLVPSRGCVLTDALYTLVSNRGAQNTGWPLPDVQHTVEHQSTCMDQHTCAHAVLANAGMQIHAHHQSSLQVADWSQVIKYSCVATSIETKPWRTLESVCKRISLFLLLAFFFFCQACFVDCFSSACSLFYLSVCSLSFSLSFPSLPLSLSPLAQSALSGL